MPRKDYLLPWNYRIGRFFFKREDRTREKKEAFRLKNVLSIGFLFDASESLEPFYAIKELINLFNKDNKHILRKTQILAYSKYENLDKQFHVSQFNKHDFNFFGLPKSISVKEFANNRFGLLIDYSNGSNPYIENILSLSNAEFKVGSRLEINGKEENLDFIINIKHSGVDSFNPSVINYLSNTNTNE